MSVQLEIPKKSLASSCPVGTTSHSLSIGLVRFGLFRPCCVLEIFFSSASLYISKTRRGAFTINLLLPAQTQGTTAPWTSQYAVTRLSMNWSRTVGSAHLQVVALCSRHARQHTWDQRLGSLGLLAKTILLKS